MKNHKNRNFPQINSQLVQGIPSLAITFLPTFTLLIPLKFHVSNHQPIQIGLHLGSFCAHGAPPKKNKGTGSADWLPLLTEPASDLDHGSCNTSQ